MQPSFLVVLGNGTCIARSRIVAVIPVEKMSRPLKKFRKLQEASGRIIDVSNGEKIRSYIVCDSDHLFLSSSTTETIHRMLDVKGKYHGH